LGSALGTNTPVPRQKIPPKGIARNWSYPCSTYTAKQTEFSTLVGGQGASRSSIIFRQAVSGNMLTIAMIRHCRLSEATSKILTLSSWRWMAMMSLSNLATNPDIARAATESNIDFREGTFLTQQVVEAMRQTNAKRILYSSGSGIYGDLGEVEAHEDMGPLVPVSTYGASKLAGEARCPATNVPTITLL
jgi:hypothetical protein